MRVVHAAGLAVVVVLLASMASAQGLGDAAAREREKRKVAPSGPVKVITERDLGPASSMPATPVAEPVPGAAASAGAPPAPGADAGAAAGAGAGADAAAQPGAQPEGQPGVPPGAQPGAAPEDPEAAAAEAAQKAREEWQARLDEARHEETAVRQSIGQLEAATSDPNAMYSPGWTRAMNDLDQKKQQLVELQSRIQAIETEGSRAGYR